MRRNEWIGRLMFVALASAACSKGTGGGDGEGDEITDPCNSAQEAFGQDCLLTFGGEQKVAYISFGGDQDYYGVQMPAQVSPGKLLRITGGYNSPGTPVNFSVNILRENGSSVATITDSHPQSAAKPVDLLLPFAEASVKLVLLVRDASANPSLPSSDVKAPYFLKVDLLDNPDANEPNDAAPTAVTLSPSSGMLTGSGNGYLATQGDVDKFAIAVPSSTSPRKILYTRVSASTLSPPPPYFLSYVLESPNGSVISEGRVTNEFIAADLATARVAVGGTYVLTVKGVSTSGSAVTAQGDLRLQYNVEVKVLDEEDTHEPNDDLGTAENVNFSQTPAGGVRTMSVTGRLEHVPDQDWYSVQLPAYGSASVLYFRLEPTSTGGRFAPIPGAVDRQLRVVTQTSTSTACKDDDNVCPKSYALEPSGSQQLVESLCERTPPQCLWAERNEATQFANLKNFEGAIRVPSHGSTVSYLVTVQDEGNNWADDRDYTLHLEWRPLVGQSASSATLPEDTSGNTEGVVPPAGASTFTGQLAYGHGRFRRNRLDLGQGIRGALDYDAQTSETHRYQLNVPTGMVDRTWELQWEVDRNTDEDPVHDILVQITFCDSTQAPTADTTCGSSRTVTTNSRGDALVLGYQPDNLRGWANDGTKALQPLWERASSAASDVTTATTYSCLCLEPRFANAGTFFIDVMAVDRNTYDAVDYTLKTAWKSYPQTFSVPGGGTDSCPAPGANAGCRFTLQ